MFIFSTMLSAKAHKYFFLLPLFYISFFTQAQNIDSLVNALNKSKNDTIKINILLSLIENVSDDKVWPLYNDQMLQLSEKLLQDKNESIIRKGKKGLAEAYNNLAFIYNNQGDIPKALDYFGQSLKLQQEVGSQLGVAELLGNMGAMYHNQNDMNKALEYGLKSLEIREKIGDKEGIAHSLNNIGSVYYKQNNMHKSLVYYGKSMKLQEEIGDKLGIAYSLNNIGGAYFHEGDIFKALDYYIRSLKIREEIDDKQGIVASLHNIGVVYLDLSSKKDVPAGGLSHIKFKLGKANNLKLALGYTDSSLVLSKKLRLPENTRNAERLISRIDSAGGNYASAFQHYKQYIIYRDSIVNQETHRAGIKNHLKYEFDKKEAIIKEQQEKERAIAEEKSHFQQIIIIAVALGFIIVIIFAAFVFRTLKTTRLQKTIIEEKQREILDSIHYAKKIQTALMTNENYIEKSLNKLSKK